MSKQYFGQYIQMTERHSEERMSDRQLMRFHQDHMYERLRSYDETAQQETDIFLANALGHSDDRDEYKENMPVPFEAIDTADTNKGGAEATVNNICKKRPAEVLDAVDNSSTLPKRKRLRAAHPPRAPLTEKPMVGAHLYAGFCSFACV
jgi:hypothetical protein